ALKPNGQIKSSEINAQRAALANHHQPNGQPKTGSALFQVSQTKTGSARPQAQRANQVQRN
ncbi:MAG: hypothetical protein RR536_07895, partial [Anaerovoracaceae bacterium]